MNAIFLDDDDDRIQGQSVELALEIEQQIQGLEASTVIFALCWILASLALQGENQKHLPTTESIEMIAKQLSICVARLRERSPSSRIH